MKNLKSILFTACALFSLGVAASTEHTTIQGDHGKLDVVIHRPDDTAHTSGKQAKACKKTPLLVLCHGFGGNKEGKLFDCLADSLNKKGIAVIRFDFNGHGKSEGKFEDMTVLNEIEDAKCILHGDADRVVPYTYGQRFHYLNPKSEWHLMSDADHGFSHQEEQAAHIASDFLAKALK